MAIKKSSAKQSTNSAQSPSPARQAEVRQQMSLSPVVPIGDGKHWYYGPPPGRVVPRAVAG